MSSFPARTNTILRERFRHGRRKINPDFKSSWQLTGAIRPTWILNLDGISEVFTTHSNSSTTLDPPSTQTQFLISMGVRIIVVHVDCSIVSDYTTRLLSQDHVAWLRWDNIFLTSGLALGSTSQHR